MCRRARWAFALALAFAGSAIAGLGCKRAESSTGAPAAPSAGLPALVLRDDSAGLTFSYLTVVGDFRLAKQITDVPYESRDAVRVWVDATAAGVAGPSTYLADLRTKRGDGTYKVEVVNLKYFDDLAADRRNKVPVGSQAPSAPSIAGAPPAPGAARGDKPTGTNEGNTITIYGADWCKPCHAAEAYFKAKGLAYVHKDVDDPVVNEEMRDILANAGIRSGSIPIINVRGEVLVGFEARAIDRALAKHPLP